MKIRQLTAAGYAAGLAGGLGLMLAYGAMEMSSTPRFCGACHVMTPYFESWQTSSHNSIACVDCHIPPGITAELRKKYEAIAMVARYFTGTYGTNPWAEVDDSACLECHERRLLVGKEVFGDILFDHGPHLSELRRGKRLQCTSCHSQIVQGSHITVTSTSCILCHFKGQEAGAGTAKCTLCHRVPDRVVDAGGLRFDHGDVSRFGMACQACHELPRPESGDVPRERCLTCHNEPDRLAEYENGDLLHQTHVTEHKVECTHCHLEIEHVPPRHTEATRTECSTCHDAGHSAQRTLYAGIGGKGVPPQPDVMFRAGVRCEGCHLDRGEGESRTAGEISCMSCHGPAYRALFSAWTDAVRQRVSGMRRQMDRSAAALGPQPPSSYSDARANLELVEGGRGIHNVPYSLSLLEAASRQLNEARSERSLEPLPVPWPELPYQSTCGVCHVGAESTTVEAFGRSFPHRVHVIDRRIDCERCHTTHSQRMKAGVGSLRLEASSCDSCHHGEAARACLDCHGEVLRRTFTVELGEFDHSFHAEAMALDCGHCHGAAPAVGSADRQACADCH